MHDFVSANRAFWSAFPAKPSQRLLLMEEPRVPLITHGNAVFSVLLNQARGLTPVWMSKSKEDEALAQSYVATSSIAALPTLPRPRRWLLALRALLALGGMMITRDILRFSFDGVRYGDIVYDTYIAQEQLGTIRGVPVNIFWVIYQCMLRHASVRALLRTGPYEAVFVSHQVGLRSGTMLRAGLRHGCTGYLRCGHGTLKKMHKLDEVYDYPYKPTPAMIDALVAKFGSDIDRLFTEELDRQVSGTSSTSRDSAYAFSPQNKFFRDRPSFAQDFGVDPGKKNAFVMLHAMNDHPHSHFRWMLFRDYYDWFEKTLEFAKTRPEVNWIFKQHPSIRFYPMRDVSFDALFRNAPPHIVYISEHKQIDTRSLVYCADWVITCAGSAGFELPAMAGIPSIVASENAYSELGFAREPRTREQYFSILKDIGAIAPLSPEQQRRARATYLYNYNYARMPVTACPFLSFTESKDPKQDEWYWTRVEELYATKKSEILDEMRRYIADIARPDFVQLSRLPM